VLSALLTIAATLVAAVPALADPGIAAKEAQAQQVLAQIQTLDSQLEKAVEAYDSATVKLQRIHSQLTVNRYKQKVARTNLRAAERRLADRLRDLYVSDSGDSTLEVLLGSTSLDDVISRLDTVNRVSSQDTQVLREVKRFRREVVRNGELLRHANRVQKAVVAARAAARARIEQGLSDRQRLLSSIKGEIEKLKAAEAARQALLQAQARARLVQLQRQQQERLNTTIVGITAQAPTGSSDSGSVATVAPPSHYGGVVAVAMAQLGKPYVFATAGPSTFDCSGLVVYAYAALGVSLPHSTYSLWNLGVYVPRDQLQPGDLVFFDGLGHVGIYIGGGQFIHAPHTGDVVKISSLSESWYAATYVGARRIL
jgi:cell wall-associated NlpC family hydrolase